MKPARLALEQDTVEQLDAGEVRYPSQGQRDLSRFGEKQLWVAGELGISQTTVSQLATGERRPTIDQAIAIEERLGTPARFWKLDRPGRPLTSTERSRRKRAVERMQRDAIVASSTADTTQRKRDT